MKSILKTLLILFLQFSMISICQGQTREYDFQKGQVIEYSYSCQRDARDYIESIDYIYKFYVDSVKANRFYIRMNTKPYLETIISEKKQNSPYYIQSAFIDSKKGDMDYIYGGDINQDISFIITRAGIIKEINGNDSLLKKAIAEFSSNKGVAGKAINNFQMLTHRFSDEYYKYLIHQFLPQLKGLNSKDGNSQVYEFSYPHDTLRVSNNLICPIEGSSTWILDFKLTLNKTEKDNEKSYVLVHNPPGHVYWNEQTCMVDSTSFIGSFLPPIMVQFSFGDIDFYDLNDPSGYLSKNIDIKLETNTIHNHTEVNYNIKNAKGSKYLVQYPGDFINRTSVETFIDSDLHISNPGYSIQKPDILDIEIREPKLEQNSWKGIVRKIRIFVKPGDTTILTLDWNKFDDAIFEGPFSPENNLLNLVTKNLTNSTSQNMLETLLNSQETFKSMESSLDKSFNERMEFEFKYKIATEKLERLTSGSYTDDSKNLNGALRSFKPLLGQIIYHKTPVYEEFLLAYLKVNQYNAGIIAQMGHPSEYSAAEIFLQGWDRYYVLANITLDQLNRFPNDDYDNYVQRFLNDYANSDFGIQINKLYNILLKYSSPDILKQFSINGLPDRASVISLNYGPTSKWFIEEFVDYYSKRPNGNLGYIQYVKEEEYDKVLDELTKKYSSFKMESSQGKSILTVRVLPDDFSEHEFRYFNHLMCVDKDGQFVNYVIRNAFDFINLDLVSSWPKLLEEPEKTVNLKKLWYGLGGLFIIFFAVLITMRIRAKKQKSKLELQSKISDLELKVVRSRMNPHFMFNALNSIQSMINQNQIENANIYLAKFGDLIRKILDQSKQNSISLKDEISTLSTYLDLEKLGVEFQYSIAVDPEIDQELIDIPPLLIQPHVENAIIHGISGMSGKGIIEIEFRIDNEKLICRVKDNGPGLSGSAKDSDKNGLGQGWTMTKERVKILNRKFDGQLKVEISSDGKDT